MVFGFGKKFGEVEPEYIPSHWVISDTNVYAKKRLQYFLEEHNLDIPELERLKILVKKGVDDFLKPVIKKGHYKNIEIFTLQELDTLPDLSDKKYNKFVQFFKFHEMNELKLNGKDVSLFALKEFTPINQVDKIPTVIVTDMNDDESESYTCKICSGQGSRMEQVRKRNREFSQESPDGWYTETENVKCYRCNGKGIVGFYFKKFRKSVEKYNITAKKKEKEIFELNNKSIQLVVDYNNTIQKLNEKIKIWNSKCPENAIDRNHEGKDDYLKYWLEGDENFEEKELGNFTPQEQEHSNEKYYYATHYYKAGESQTQSRQTEEKTKYDKEKN